MKILGRLLPFDIVALYAIACCVSAFPKQSDDPGVLEDTEENLGGWIKVSSSPVCFGAKNNEFGSFHANFYGKLAAVRLVHLYGYVSCDARHKTYWSYWGCGSYGAGLGKINVVVTTKDNTVILPPGELIVTDGSKWSQIPGYDSVSPELVLSFFQPRQYGEELRLWYGEDLTESGEGDNGGTACVGVYAFVL